MKSFQKTLGVLALSLGTASPALAFEEGKLTIWLGPNKGSANLQEVAKKFTADSGVEVVIEEVDPAVEKFQQAAATGDGPDITLWGR